LKEDFMKKVMLIVVCVAISSSFAATPKLSEQDLLRVIAALKFKTKTQSELINQLKAECIATKKENKVIEKYFNDAGLELPKRKELITLFELKNDSNDIYKMVYRGNIRDDTWLLNAYQNYGHQIIKSGGGYINQKEFRQTIPVLSHSIEVPVGVMVRLPSGFKILNTLGRGEYLISNSDSVFHIKNLNISYIDDEPLPNGYFKGAGLYTYDTSAGSNKTVASLIPTNIQEVS
jgi:hypothetical protein